MIQDANAVTIMKISITLCNVAIVIIKRNWEWEISCGEGIWRVRSITNILKNKE